MSLFKVSGPEPLADGSQLLILAGDLDTRGNKLMERTLARLAERDIRRVTVDLDRLTFISRSGVALLLRLVYEVREAGGDAVFVNIPMSVRSVFRLLEIEDVIAVRDATAADA